MSTTFISTTRSTVSRNELARHTAAYRTPVQKTSPISVWDGEPILATTGDKYSVRTLNNTAYRVHSQKYAWHSPHVNIQKIEKRKEILRNGIFGGLFGLTLTIGLLVASPTAEEPVGTPATVARVNTQ